MTGEQNEIFGKMKQVAKTRTTPTLRFGLWLLGNFLGFFPNLFTTLIKSVAVYYIWGFLIGHIYKLDFLVAYGLTVIITIINIKYKNNGGRGIFQFLIESFTDLFIRLSMYSLTAALIYYLA